MRGEGAFGLWDVGLGLGMSKQMTIERKVLQHQVRKLGWC